MRGRWWTAGLLAGLTALSAPLASAQSSAPASPIILTLDEERLFRDSQFGKAILARQEAAAQALTAENRQIEAALEAEERGLTDQRATMTREAFQPLSEAFNIKVEGIRRAQDTKTRALNRQFDEERQRFFGAVRPVLARVMQDRGAVAIIDKRAVFVGFEDLDITAAAVAALDATLGDGGPPPQPAPEITPQTTAPSQP